MKHNGKKILFARIGYSLLENENRWFYLVAKKILSTENNVRPNHDDSDHVLFITIMVNLLSKV
jgi:hypothetical protein